MSRKPAGRQLEGVAEKKKRPIGTAKARGSQEISDWEHATKQRNETTRKERYGACEGGNLAIWGDWWATGNLLGGILQETSYLRIRRCELPDGGLRNRHGSFQGGILHYFDKNS